MPVRNVKQWFEQACAKWPKIKWGFADYEKHVGSDNPPYPIDLFLAGSAGQRFDEAWTAIHFEIGPKVRSVLQGQPKADLTSEELSSQAISRLFAEDEDTPHLPDGRRPARIIRYRGLAPLLNYFVLIAKRLGIQRKRQMRPTMSIAGEDEGRPAPQIADVRQSPAENAEAAEQSPELRNALSAAFAEFSPEQQYLIAMVYRDGMKQKDAGALIGWSEFKTCRSLAAAIGALREAVVRKIGPEWNSGMAAAWEQAWQNCWNSVQVPRGSASVKAKGMRISAS